MSDTFFLVTGIVLTVIAILILAAKLKVRISCRIGTEAEITGLQVETTFLRGSSVHRYRPKYRYTAEGKENTGVATFSSLNEKKYRAGEKLVLYYDPAHPETVCFRRFDAGIPVSLLILASGIILIVCYFL